MPRRPRPKTTSHHIDPVALLCDKRDGKEHTSEQIHGLIEGFMKGSLAEYQMSAWLMATFLNGLSEPEMLALTDAMLHSGSVLSLDGVALPKVDKHSTGGVGDKVSLCLAPLVAECGVAVPMMAGRGLGHTGGTLDKLESIPGYQVHLSPKAFERIVAKVGTSIIGQTSSLAPADRRVYALRDVTGTVSCIPLIVASILSKKLAEGIDALVLDVKVGRGAFMKDLRSARALARALAHVGIRAEKRVSALLTNMDVPLGTTIGNALELREAIEVLQGRGPGDTRELTLALGAEMLLSAGVAHGRPAARQKLERALGSGAPLERFARMVRLHGGDPTYVLDPKRLPKTRFRMEVTSSRSGWVHDVDPLALGQLAVALGAGRRRSEDSVDHAVGIELCQKPGDRVAHGEPLAVLHVRERHASWAQRAQEAFTIEARKPTEDRKLVLDRIVARHTKRT